MKYENLLVLKGRSEGETGAWIRNLSQGLVPDPGESSLGDDRPWFRKIHVAYPGWKEPDPGRIEPFLDRVHQNIAKLKSNPSIRTVIDL